VESRHQTSGRAGIGPPIDGWKLKSLLVKVVGKGHAVYRYIKYRH
jgi:hypothetical protein